MASEDKARKAIDECAKQDVKDAARRGQNITHEQAKRVWIDVARQEDRKNQDRRK